jgi:hypothetical protein
VDICEVELKEMLLRLAGYEHVKVLLLESLVYTVPRLPSLRTGRPNTSLREAPAPPRHIRTSRKALLYLATIKEKQRTKFHPHFYYPPSPYFPTSADRYFYHEISPVGLR